MEIYQKRTFILFAGGLKSEIVNLANNARPIYSTAYTV